MSKQFTSLHHDPYIASLMARGVIGKKNGVPISGLTDSLTRDPSFIDFYNESGEGIGWTDEQWSFVADQDFQSGFYTPGVRSIVAYIPTLFYSSLQPCFSFLALRCYWIIDAPTNFL